MTDLPGKRPAGEEDRPGDLVGPDREQLPLRGHPLPGLPVLPRRAEHLEAAPGAGRLSTRPSPLPDAHLSPPPVPTGTPAHLVPGRQSSTIMMYLRWSSLTLSHRSGNPCPRQPTDT